MEFGSFPAILSEILLLWSVDLCSYKLHFSAVTYLNIRPMVGAFLVFVSFVGWPLFR